MQLGKVINHVALNGCRFANSVIDYLNTPVPPEEPADLSELLSTKSYTRRAFLLLEDEDMQYRRLKQRLFDSILKSEKNDKFARWWSFEEDDTRFCKNAVIYTADMLDHGKMLSEIVDGLGLQPATVAVICKFFMDLEDESEEN